MNRLEIS